MALNSVIRNASRVVVPLGRRWCFRRHYSSASASAPARVMGLSGSMLQRSFHQYSTKTRSDGLLLQALEEEISCAYTSRAADDEYKEVPEGFPFKIKDHDGMETIMLTREHKGETISVEVHMPNLVTGYEEGDDSPNHCSLPLVVKTSKKSGPYLEFGCTAYPDEIVIDSLSVKHPEISEEQIAYEGPDFGDLDENLQKAFHRYLEIRGIKPSTTNFLHGYMIEKDTRIYLEWLRKVEKFLQA
ncbi:hypothetical protein C2S51_033791 [Perilla frutescens var. frutescens]|nr:hypothetical protein C2S51_033791 [Perilla frutescens var. frutescens]